MKSMLLTAICLLLIAGSGSIAYADSLSGCLCGNACSQNSGTVAGGSDSSFCQDQPSSSCTANSSDPHCNPVSGADGILLKVDDIISFIAGIAAVVMILVGSIQFITSGGDSGRVSSAKNIVIAALIGIVIIALAQIIIWFALGYL